MHTKKKDGTKEMQGQEQDGQRDVMHVNIERIRHSYIW